MLNLEKTTAFVTGANRGIGRALTEALLEAGVAKVYAAARNTDALAELAAGHAGRLVPVTLDVTNADSIKAAVAGASDVTLLVNNAGIAGYTGALSADAEQQARAEMEVNYFAPLALTKAFAPVLQANGGGAVSTVSSIAAHSAFPVLGTYSASKAAVHLLTQSLRAELAAAGTYVSGIYPGPVETSLAAGFDGDKTPAGDVARDIVAALAKGEEEIFPDEASRQLITAFDKDRRAVERMTAAYLPAA